MEKNEFKAYCQKYVNFARFTPTSGSIPEARKKDLVVFAEMAENMNPKVLSELSPVTAEAVCSAYYLGKYGKVINKVSGDMSINLPGGMPKGPSGHRHSTYDAFSNYSGGVSGHRH